jgi:hypothetical protein
MKSFFVLANGRISNVRILKCERSALPAWRSAFKKSQPTDFLT